MTEEILELHQSLTMYRLTEVETDEKAVYIRYSRPQDWGDPKWKYFQCKIEVAQYVYHRHIWHQNEESKIQNCFCLGHNLFMFLEPGQRRELCDKSHLDLEDWWDEEWGEQPPTYEEPEDID